jgi:acyl CoA:acetate/3-ketoacid CoA transferase beta subunit
MQEKEYAKEFTSGELMAVAGAHIINDGDLVICGIGLPEVCTFLAIYTHAPNAKILMEQGVVEPKPIHTSMGVADPREWFGSKCFTDYIDIMGMTLQRGLVDVGFIGGLEVDMYGNVNSTLIGTYDKPERYFTGSGGANDIASLAKKVVVIMRPHERRRFPERVAFITSPGFISGPDARERAGLRGGGPYRVITDLAVLGFDENTKRMKLLAINPKVTVKDVQERTGFELLIPKRVEMMTPPTVEEQRIIREILDKEGLYTGWNREEPISLKK